MYIKTEYCLYREIDALLCCKCLVMCTMAEKTKMKDISHTAPNGGNDTQRVYNRGGEVVPTDDSEDNEDAE